VTIEHNGDVYGCGHFVERRWQLAQIGEPEWTNAVDVDGRENVGLTIHGTGYAPNEAHAGRDILNAEDVESKYAVAVADSADMDTAWFNRADASRLTHFSARKQGNLPEKCQTCDYRAYCHGGCPEHRPHGGDRNEEATILCEGYLHFYRHSMDRLQWLAGYLRRGVQPPAAEINQRAGAATDSQIGKRMPVGAAAGGNGRKAKRTMLRALSLIPPWIRGHSFADSPSPGSGCFHAGLLLSCPTLPPRPERGTPKCSNARTIATPCDSTTRTGPSPSSDGSTTTGTTAALSSSTSAIAKA